MTDIRELLAEGGLSAGGIDQVTSGGEAHAAPRFQSLANPSATEELGRRIAKELSTLRPDRLLIAGESHDQILAFVVARELGCAVTVVWNSEGLLEQDGTLHKSDRIVILGESFRSPDSLHGLASFASYRGASIVAAAALIASPILQKEAADLGLRIIALVHETA